MAQGVNIIHAMMELTRRSRAYPTRVATLLRHGQLVGWQWMVMFMLSYLLPHFPQALQTMEQVAAPQQLAAKDMIYWTDLRVSLG